MYHPSLLNYPELQSIRETTDKLSLEELWIASGNLTAAGLQGANYLLANKIYDTLQYSAARKDICPLIGQVVTGWEGADLIVPIAVDNMFTPKQTAGGGKAPEQEPTFTYAKLTCPDAYTLNMNIGQDLVDDNAIGLVQTLIQKAGYACGKLASDLAITALLACADGDGTANTATCAGTDTMLWSEIATAIKAVEADHFNPNTLLITHESMTHNVINTCGVETTGADANRYWQPNYPHTSFPQPTAGYDMKLYSMDVVFNGSDKLHDSTDVEGAAFTTCIAEILDRDYALLTGRKRWLMLENFSDPKQDLADAVVSFRQDSVTLYKDASYKLTEKT